MICPWQLYETPSNAKDIVSPVIFKNYEVNTFINARLKRNRLYKRIARGSREKLGGKFEDIAGLALGLYFGEGQWPPQ